MRFLAIVGAGLVAGVTEVGVTARAWADCDVGINAGANSLTLLLFVLPALWAVHVGALGAAGRLTAGHGPALQGAAAVIVLIAIALLVGVFIATPGGYPDPLCPANVPPWWPGWLPA